MSKKIQMYRQFDIVQYADNGRTGTGIVTVVSGKDAAVRWFGEPRFHTAWWGPEELTIIGNAMTEIMAAMNGHCQAKSPNEQFPIQMGNVKE